MLRMSRLCRSVVALATFMACPVALGQSFVNFETPQVNPIALTPDGTRLLACNTADNRLEVFDISGGGGNSASPVKIASISVGLEPVSVRARTNSEVWVVNHLSDSISIIDLNTMRVFRTVVTGDEPCDVVFAGSRGNQRAFVSVSQLNQVRVFDPANLAGAPIIVNIQGEDPRALAVSADGSKVFAAIFESGNRSTVIPRNVVSQPASPYGGVNPPPNSGNVFNPPIAPGLPAPPPNTMIVKQNAANQWMDDNNRNWTPFVTWGLHDHDVAIIDTTSFGITYASGLMNMVANLAVAPDGTVSTIGTDAINEVRFVENVNSIFIRCQIGSFNPASPATISKADINPHLNYSVSIISQSQRDLSIGDPRGIVWHPSGSKAYVSGMGSNNVIATDTSGTRMAQIEVGQGPTGLAINAAGSRLYVLNKFDGSVSTIDTAGESELSRVSFFDPTPNTIKLGRPFLYNTHTTSGLGQASCASCHIDGRTDHLGWDLGDPAGSIIVFNQQCQAPAGPCINWHPMKGNMVTQTLQGIIGNEPLHWRGEKDSLLEFNVAFTDLQSRDSMLTGDEMTQFQNFIATITYPPNPNRNLDNTLRTVLPVTGGNGNAATGRNIYLNQPILPGGLRCVDCHALPNGTNNRVDIPVLPGEPQNRKNAQLRNMNEKTGFDRTTQNGNRGFGFDHDGDEAGIIALLSAPGFNFAPGAAGAQQRRDIEAFLMSFSVDMHAGVGQQITIGDGSVTPPLVTQMITMAQSNAVGLIVKRTLSGLARGYMYNSGTSLFQSDRSGESIAPAALLASASLGNELTYTLVPKGSESRIGIDRDSDGFLDRDEMDFCSDAANPLITPLNVCKADIVPSDSVNIDDLVAVITSWGSSGIPGNVHGDIAPDCGNGVVNIDDLVAVITAWGPCP